MNYNFKGLLLSIVNINDPRFLDFLSIHLPDRIGDVSTIDLKINPRPSLALYRLASLAVVRSILIENGKISISQLSDIHIDHYPSGAPFLGDNFPSLSVSHSGIWVGCLLGGEHKAVGLDIEDMGEEGNLTSRPYMELANYAFSPLEIDFVNRYQKEGFYRIWTAKEAIAKCQGQGLDYALELDLGEQFLDFFGSIDNQVEEKISFTLKVPTRHGVDPDFNIYSIGQQIIEKNLMVTVCEQKSASIFQGLGRTIYKQRYLILAASLIYAAVTELPTASDSLGINCTTMKPSMTLCQYGYFESARLTDICQYGCNNYSGTLEDLAYGMLNNCCDYYGYFFDYY